MLEDIFRTNRGVYQLDTDNGLFTRKDQISTPKLIFGSVDPLAMLRISDGYERPLRVISPECQCDILILNLMQGQVSGFSPEFKKGFYPLGVVCDSQEISQVGPGYLTFSDSLIRKFCTKGIIVPRELGSEILEVYRQLKDEERNYRIFH